LGGSDGVGREIDVRVADHHRQDRAPARHRVGQFGAARLGACGLVAEREDEHVASPDLGKELIPPLLASGEVPVDPRLVPGVLEIGDQVADDLVVSTCVTDEQLHRPLPLRSRSHAPTTATLLSVGKGPERVGQRTYGIVTPLRTTG
jgi:hypothetical protein